MKLLSIITFIIFAPLIFIWFFSELIRSIKITPNKRLPP